MKKIKMSDSEYIIMRELWGINSPVSSADIVNRLRASTNWAPKTIHTFLRRLVSKGMVTAEKDGNFYKYSPSVSRSEYTHFETKSFLEKVYDGSISNLVIHFTKHENISKEELDKLKEMLEAAEKEE